MSAFGLLTVDVKNDYVQTHVTLADRLDPAAVAGGVRRAHRARPPPRWPRRASPRSSTSSSRTADLRYFGQAFEVRVPVARRRLDPAALDAVADAFHAEHRALYGYDFSGDATQQVEWVNLRVSGIGPIQRPEIQAAAAHRLVTMALRPLDDARSTAAGLLRRRPRGTSTPRSLRRPDLAPGDGSTGRRSSRSSARRCRSTRASRPRSTTTSTSS